MARNRLEIALWLVCSLLLTAATGGASRSQGDPAPRLPEDRPLAETHVELLELAFDTATAIPLKPHIKDRARAQEKVVEACLKLDQPRRAARYIDQIPNWRRGAGYADLAFYCARNGHEDLARQYLDKAARLADAAADWRRGRIRMKIARAYALLGDAEKARQFGRNLDKWESGKTAGAATSLEDDAAFEQRLAALGGLIESGEFDPMTNAMRSCAELYRQFYENADRRRALAEKIEGAFSKVPVFLRIDLLARMAEGALEHDDPAEALARVDRMQKLMEGSRWPLRYRIPLMARVAELRFRAEDPEAARALADAAWELFEAEGQRIVNIYRAETLQPLAEAYQTMGRADAALAVYGRAVEEGVQNPNSRPRAEDLSATCCSMALHEVEPDAELWRRIRRVRKALGEPW